MCQNIDDFNRGAALIFARLYSNFPHKIIIRPAELDDGSDLLQEKVRPTTLRGGRWLARIQPFRLDQKRSPP